MTKLMGDYIPEMVRVFYADYMTRIKNMTPFVKQKDMKKRPKLDMVLVLGVLIDILEKTISIALFGADFEPSAETVEYDYQMIKLK